MAKTLKRTARLRRRKPLKLHNLARKKQRREACFGEQAYHCTKRPCCVCNRFPSDAHHEPTRAAGGRDRDTLPLCRAHHIERHTLGRVGFEAKHGVDLRQVAAQIHSRLETQ